MIDLPALPPHAQVMVVQAPQAQRSLGRMDRIIGVCGLVGNPMHDSALNSVAPTAAALIYFHNIGELLDVGSGVATVLSKPQHGTLKPNPDAPGGYLYLPGTHYFGPDRATFVVEIGNKRVRVEYFFKVLEGGVADGDYQDKELCPMGTLWKVSLHATDPIGARYTVRVVQWLSRQQSRHNNGVQPTLASSARSRG
jgi:hypothetical protein